MVRHPAPQPIATHTPRLSAVYLPAFCSALVEPPQPGVAVVLESNLEPMVRVSSRCEAPCDSRDRIVLLPHGKPLRPPAREGDTCDPYLFRMALAIRAGFRRNIFPP